MWSCKLRNIKLLLAPMIRVCIEDVSYFNKRSKSSFSDWSIVEVELQRLPGQLEYCDWWIRSELPTKLLLITLWQLPLCRNRIDVKNEKIPCPFGPNHTKRFQKSLSLSPTKGRKIFFVTLMFCFPLYCAQKRVFIYKRVHFDALAIILNIRTPENTKRNI